RLEAVASGIVLWLGIVALLWSARKQDGEYFADTWHWIQPLTIAGVILTLFFWERLRYRLLPIVLGLLFVWSNGGINPVMRGLSPLLNSAAFNAIDRIRRADPE